MWLTETGGIVQFNPELPEHPRIRSDARGQGAQVHVLGRGADPQIARLYIFDWTGGVDATHFDAGLMDRH